MVDRVEREVEAEVLGWEFLACSRSGSMNGWVERIAALPAIRNMYLKGMRWAVRKSSAVKAVRRRKAVEETISSEKLVIGPRVETMASCRVEKSAMLFWRSRRLRKKSLDVSGTGLMVVAGARAGPS